MFKIERPHDEARFNFLLAGAKDGLLRGVLSTGRIRRTNWLMMQTPGSGLWKNSHHAEGRDPGNLQYDTIALIALMLLAMTIAVTRFRRTLD